LRSLLLAICSLSESPLLRRGEERREKTRVSMDGFDLEWSCRLQSDGD